MSTDLPARTADDSLAIDARFDALVPDGASRGGRADRRLVAIARGVAATADRQIAAALDIDLGTSVVRRIEAGRPVNSATLRR